MTLCRIVKRRLLGLRYKSVPLGDIPKVGANQSSQVSSASIRDELYPRKYGSLTRGSVLGIWLVGEQKHNELMGLRHTWSLMNYSSIIQVCNRPSEETYPGPLLVNVELPYPHRE